MTNNISGLRLSISLAIKIIKIAHPLIRESKIIFPDTPDMEKWADRDSASVAWVNSQGMLQAVEHVGPFEYKNVEWANGTFALAPEKCVRTISSRQVSSWATRHPPEKRYGGAVTIWDSETLVGALGNSGYPEPVDDRLSAYSTNVVGLQTQKSMGDNRAVYMNDVPDGVDLVAIDEEVRHIVSVAQKQI